MEDWITQHQNEEKAKQAAEEQRWAREASRREEITAWVKGQVGERVEHSLSEVNRRLGRNFTLTNSHNGYGVRVEEKDPTNVPPRIAFFEMYCYDKNPAKFYVRGNRGWDPAAMPPTWEGSVNDWAGEDWEIKVRPLEGSLVGDDDIQALFKWLLAGQSSDPPKLSLPLATSESKTKGPSLLSEMGCFVATVVYGAPDASEVQALRFFRDRVLAQRRMGKIIINGYYAVGPGLARVVAKAPIFKLIIRVLLLAPVVFFVTRANERIASTARKP